MERKGGWKGKSKEEYEHETHPGGAQGGSKMVKSLNYVHLYCPVFCADYLNYFLGLSNRRGNEQLRQQKLLSLKSRLTSWTKYSQEGIGKNGQRVESDWSWSLSYRNTFDQVRYTMYIFVDFH